METSFLLLFISILSQKLNVTYRCSMTNKWTWQTVQTARLLLKPLSTGMWSTSNALKDQLLMGRPMVLVWQTGWLKYRDQILTVKVICWIVSVIYNIRIIKNFTILFILSITFVFIHSYIVTFIDIKEKKDF